MSMFLVTMVFTFLMLNSMTPIKWNELKEWDCVIHCWETFIYSWNSNVFYDADNMIRSCKLPYDEYIYHDGSYIPYLWMKQYQIDMIYSSMISKKYIARKRVCIQDIISYMRDNNSWDINHLNKVWWNLFKNIESQSEECINYVYSLIK